MISPKTSTELCSMDIKNNLSRTKSQMRHSEVLETLWDCELLPAEEEFSILSMGLVGAKLVL